MAPRLPGRQRFVLGAALALATAAVFSPAVGLPFVSFDDPEYFTLNPNLRSGLTLRVLGWALTTGHAANWHPLTWLTHAADVSLFGLDPVGPHAVNLVLHVASTVLLFLLACRLTGATLRSALLAALFALHPLRVESVAWVSERKDVLATFFWLATTLAWTWHLEAPSRRRLALTAGLFAMGLTSKAMLVTLPFTLLLLDGWPLGRLELARPSLRALWPLLREKWLLFALSAGASAATFLVQRSWGAVRSGAALPFGDRAVNALVSVFAYLGQWAWPANLAVFYPYPEARPSAPLVAALLTVLAATLVLVWRLRHRAPHLLVGWLWYLGTLVPVVGLVQVGYQAMADRYTYVPSIGLGLAVVWSLPGLERLGARARAATWAAALALVAVLSALTVRQLAFWRSDAALFEHALEVTGRNWLAEQVLGRELERRGDVAGAVARYREALRQRPDAPEALNNLGNALVTLGSRDEGIALLREAVRRWPGYAAALVNLGGALCEAGRLDEGIPILEEAVVRAPDDAGARYNLGLALLDAGRPGEALRHLEAVLRIAPGDAAARAQVQRLRAVGVR